MPNVMWCQYTHVLVGVKLEFLSLQRCFQAKDDVLSELLEAASSSKQALRCIAVSHLQLHQWGDARPSTEQSPGLAGNDEAVIQQQQDSAPSISKQLSAQTQQISKLHALALHNCQGITPAGLQAVATACPQLQMLFLGGSTLSISSARAVAAVAPEGQIPMLNSVPRSRAAAITTLLQRTPVRWHPAARQIATELLSLAQQLPGLMLLEITFLPHGVRQELASLLSSADTNMCTDINSTQTKLSSTGRVHVLDLCEQSSIDAAATRHSKLHEHAAVGSVEEGGHRGKYVGLLLEAAANCSNAVRQTPLHVAVDRQDATAVQVSLSCLQS